MEVVSSAQAVGVDLSDQRSGRRWITLGVLCVTLLLISLDNTILNVALPTIVRSLHATSSELQWIVDAYAVTFAGLLLSIGSLGDRVGRKWVFMGGLAVFGGGSAFAAWSGSPDRLTAARVVMGVGAAALMPCTLSILTNVFTGEKDRGRAIGIWSGTAGIGVAAGPIFGGFLLDHYWWGSVFLINVPICVVGIVATIFLVPNSRNPETRRADPIGSVLSIAGFGLLLWAIIEAPNRTWSSPLIIGSLVAGVVGIASFILWELRSTHPMLPLEFFRHARFSAAIASLALVMFALLGMFFVLTQYFQFSLGYSAFQTGLRIGPIALIILVAAPLSIVAVHRFGTKPVVVSGLVMVALGLGLLSRTTVVTTYVGNFPCFLLMGIGAGLAMAPSTESIMGSLPIEQAGVGSATSDTSMQFGGGLGVAVLGTALNLRYQNHLRATLAGHALPAGISHLILGSIGGALGVAQHLPGQLGSELAHAARVAFVSGMDLGLIIASSLVGVACVVVLVVLPNRAAPAPTALGDPVPDPVPALSEGNGHAGAPDRPLDDAREPSEVDQR
jgi:EmrB/QacA subfamily drug resistance transporter